MAAALGACDRQVQVAGDRQHLRLAALEVQQHHRVGPLAGGGVGAVEAGIALALDVRARIGAHDQVVGAAAGRGERLADLDAVDAVEDAAGVQVAAHQADDQQHHQGDHHPPPAEPAPRARGGAGRRAGRVAGRWAAGVSPEAGADGRWPPGAGARSAAGGAGAPRRRRRRRDEDPTRDRPRTSVRAGGSGLTRVPQGSAGPPAGGTTPGAAAPALPSGPAGDAGLVERRHLVEHPRGRLDQRQRQRRARCPRRAAAPGRAQGRGPARPARPRRPARPSGGRR